MDIFNWNFSKKAQIKLISISAFFLIISLIAFSSLTNSADITPIEGDPVIDLNLSAIDYSKLDLTLKSYDPILKEITIKDPVDSKIDFFKAQLDSPLTFPTMFGADRQIQEITINKVSKTQDLNKLLQQPLFLDKKTNKTLLKTYKYKLKIVTGQRPITEQAFVCPKGYEGDNRACPLEVINTTYEDIIEWKEIKDLNDLPVGTFTIGVFINVLYGESGEIINNFYGIPVPEWSTWNETFSRGLIVVFPMNETDGNILNALNYSLNGTKGSSPNYTQPGVYDYGIVFNTSNKQGYFDIAPTSQLSSGTFTFSVWAKLGHVNGVQRVWESDQDTQGSWTMRTNGAKIGCGGLSSGGGYECDSGAILGANKWYMFTCTWNATSQQVVIYINGTQQCSATAGGTNFANLRATIRVGGDTHYTTIQHLNATLDELYIWNETKTPAEIAQLYDNQAGTFYGNFSQPATDNEYPQFSAYWDNNGSLINSGNAYFNVTVNNTNATVLLEINGANYTMSNLSSSLFNKTLTNLINDTFSYRYHAWGNGTSHNYNQSSLRYYTINTSIPPINRLYINFTNPTSNSSSRSNSIYINYTTNQTNPDLSQLLYLKYDNDQNVTDSSPYNKIIYRFGSTNQYNALGKYYGSWAFNAGTSSYHEIIEPNVFNTTGITISLWVNHTVPVIGTGEDIISQWLTTGNNRAFNLGVDSAGRVRLTTSPDGTASISIISNNVVNDSTWHNIQFSFNTTSVNLSLSVDGVVKNSTTTTSIFNSISNLTIGRSRVLGALNSSVDDIQIYNKTLSLTELSSLYTQNLYSRYSSFIDFNYSLVGWYRFNNLTSGDNLVNVVDSSTKSHNGTGSNIAYDTSGQFGNAMAFNGINSYINITDADYLSPNTTGKFAISFWVKPANLDFIAGDDPANGYNEILGKGVSNELNVEYTFRFYNNSNAEGRPNRMSFYLFNLSGGTGVGSFFQDNYTIGEWVHVVGMTNGTDTLIYKNGVLRDFDSLSAGGIQMGNGNGTLRIGSRTLQGFFNGSMDDVMIFNRDLSEEEVVSLYDSTRTYHNFTNLNSGTYAVQAFLQNSSGLVNYTEVRNITITNTVDNEYPQFYNFSSSIANGTQYLVNQVYNLLTTINSTNGTAIIQFNATNYTLANVSSLFNRTLSGLQAGTYPYYFGAWGNGTSHNYNTTQLYYYTILQNTTSSVSLGYSANPVTYPTSTTATGSNCPSDVTCTLYRDGVSKSNPETITLGAGTFNYTYNFTSNTNYSSKSASSNLVVNKGTLSASLVNNTVRTLTYNNTFNWTYTESNSGDGDIEYTVYRNLINVSSNFSRAIILGVGQYNFTLNSTGGANYSASSSLSNFTVDITQGTSQTGLTFDKTSPQVFGTQITPTCSRLAGEGTLVLQQDGVTITSGNALTLGVGTYSFNCSMQSTQNYTYSENVTTFTITQASQGLTILLNSNRNNLTLTYPNQVNASFNGTAQTALTINADGTILSKGINTTLGVGAYVVNFSAPSNQNYSAFSETLNVTVTKATSSIFLYLNNTRSNITIDQLQSIPLNASTQIGEGAIQLYNNGNLINQGNSPITNTSTFIAIGVFNMTARHPATQNYTSSAETFYVNVTAIPDTISPYFYNLSSETANGSAYVANAIYMFNSTWIDTDLVTNSLNKIVLTFNNTNYTATNVTSHFNASVFNLPAGTYTYSWWANDSSNNQNRTSNQSFTVSKATSQIFTYIDGSRNSKTILNGTNATLSANLSIGGGTVQLYNNNTLIGTATTSVSNITLYSVLGIYNITSIYPSTQNFTSAYETFYLTVNLPGETVQQPGGAGGSGVSQEQINADSYLCNKSYYYIQNYTKYDYTYIQDYLTQIKNETSKTLVFTTFRDYIDRWQFLCSDKINKTLEEPFVCNKIYYLLVQNSTPSFNQIENTRLTIKPTVELSVNLMEHYVDNYNDICPKKIQTIQPKPVIFNLTLPSFLPCSIVFNNSIMDAYFPIPFILSKNNYHYKGDMTCSQIDSWRYVVAIDQVDGNFVFIGIRLWWVVGLIIISFIIIKFVTMKKLKKLTLDKLVAGK